MVVPDVPQVQHAFGRGRVARSCCLYAFFLVTGFQQVEVEGAGFLKCVDNDLVEPRPDDLLTLVLRLLLAYVLCRSRK